MLENMALVLILLRVMIKSDIGRTLGEIKISPLVHLLTATMTNLALMKGEKHMGSLKWRQDELRPP